MSETAHHTGFQRLTPLAARVVLGVTIVLTGFFVAITFSRLKSGFADAPSRGPGDAALYRAEVDRIQTGQSYYDAAATELRERGYPTRSVFNWRTPLPMWLVGVLPDITASRVLLGGVGLAVILLGFGLLSDEGSLWQGGAGVLFLSGTIMPCFLGDVFLMPEIWSGLFIALSIAAYGTNRRKLGISAGLAALVLRELAAPYCLVCLALAVYERRWRELLAWMVGLTAYAAFYLFHLAQVLPRISSDDLAHAQGWIQFGAAGFVISTAQMNAYLLLLPQWVTAVYLSLALVGFAAWPTAAGRRAGFTAAIFVVAFAIVGQDFNQYWGSMIAPLLALGAARSFVTIKELVSAARRPNWQSVGRRDRVTA